MSASRLLVRLARWVSRCWRTGRGRPIASLLLLMLSLQWLPMPPGLPFQTPAPFDAFRLALFDGYQKHFPRQRITGPVTIVEIDEASLRAQGAWPWPRDRLARLI